MRLFICGISGRMGSALCAEAIADGHVIAGGLDAKGGMFPVFSSADEVTTEFDVLVDFSSPSLLPEVIKLIGRTHKPAVICTTGLSASDIEALRKTARISPVFYSENVSRGIGVALMTSTCGSPPFLLSISRCATPKRCCSSVITNARLSYTTFS